MQSHAIAPAPAKTVDNARPLHYNRCAENRVALAQLDRASGYGPEGRGFESLMLRQVKGHREVGALLLGVASRDELLAARLSRAARGSAACAARRFRPHYPLKGECPPSTHCLIRCLIPMANIPHKTNDRQSRLSLLLGVASRDELLAARKVHAARGSAAAKPTLSPAEPSERRISFEHALSHSLSYPYGEYPSQN